MAAFAAPIPIPTSSLRTTHLLPARFSQIRRHISARVNPTMTAFRKYHGLGNDFILIDNLKSSTPVLTPDQSVDVCNRNTGVGADGVIFLLPPKNTASHFSMRLYNSDGSEPEMCGNGIRCLARFAADLGINTDNGLYKVDTLAGEIIPEMKGDVVRVDMGPPILNPQHVPTTLQSIESNAYVDTLTNVAGQDWQVTAVSMGNPHSITFVSEQQYQQMDAQLEVHGPDFENHPAFPQRTNTEFVYQRSRQELDMLVWERGAGRTMACGTGACAVLVAAILTGRADRDTRVKVNLPGGPLVIEWATESNRVFMTGPAELVFEGHLAAM